MAKFWIGQRVIVADEIGVVWRGTTLVNDSPVARPPVPEGKVFVHRPTIGPWAALYDEASVHPLPNGEL